MWEYPQSFTKHLRPTLVFMWNSVLRQKSNFCFSEDFCKYWQNFHFGRGTKRYAIILSRFDIFVIFPDFLISLILSCSATREATRILIKHASFHLSWKEILLNHQKVSKCYEHDCLQTLFLLFMSLLTAFIVKNSHILAGIYFIFLKKVLEQTWKAFNTKFGHK